jgi:very-short-patch-repair endonuclease
LDIEPQARVADGHGRIIARVDLMVREVLVVEFDGAVKYEGAQGREALVAEKKREDLLRQLGFGIVRLVWSDLADPSRVQAKMLAEITILRQRRLW